MFEPISHCCSCLLWAEAGRESHLFHLGRRSNLERHQKAREERQHGTERLPAPRRACTAHQPRLAAAAVQPKSAEVFATFEIVGKEGKNATKIPFPSKHTFLPVSQRICCETSCKVPVWTLLPQSVTKRHQAAGRSLDGSIVLTGWSLKIHAQRYKKIKIEVVKQSAAFTITCMCDYLGEHGFFLSF